MTTPLHNSYAGWMPDELPNGLKDPQIKIGIEAFCATGNKGMRTTWSGGLKQMGLLEKVFFWALEFFGISTSARKENVQYQFIKLLYIASMRDLITGNTEKSLTTYQINNLLIGVSEAIKSRHNPSKLRTSLFKFTQNHEVKPNVFLRLINKKMPVNLYTRSADFGISHLQYASTIKLPCAFIIEPEIQQALSCIELGFEISDEFCIKFVEVLRNQDEAFKEVKLTPLEKQKVDVILRQALRALAKKKRFSEAAATVNELRPRLLEQKKTTPAETLQLALISICQNKTTKLSTNEQLLKEIKETKDDTLDPEELATYLILLLEESVQDYTQQLIKENHIVTEIQLGLSNLIRYYPERATHALVQLFHIGFESPELDLQVLTRAMNDLYIEYGAESLEWISLAQAAYSYAERKEILRELIADPSTRNRIAYALEKDELNEDLRKIELLTTFLGTDLTATEEILLETM